MKTCVLIAGVPLTLDHSTAMKTTVMKLCAGSVHLLPHMTIKTETISSLAKFIQQICASILLSNAET